MIDSATLLTIMFLVHFSLDFMLPLRRRLTQRTASPWKAIDLYGLGIVQGLAVMLVLGWLRESSGVALGAGLIVAASRVVLGGWCAAGTPGSAKHLLAEQGIQLSVLLAVWLVSEALWTAVPVYLGSHASSENLLVLLAYLLMLAPASTLIAALLRPWLAKINNNGSLQNAGTYIGYLERSLILTFVLLNQWEAIGFLLTAKSILRFSELKDSHQRPISEYLLLGTLLSFTLCIGLGLIVRRIIGL